METVDITLALPGSKLAEDVRKADGTLLIPMGVVLSAESIKLLQQLKIKTVNVHKSEVEQTSTNKIDTVSDALKENVCNIIATRFGKYNTTDEHINMTFKLAVEREYRTQLSKHVTPPPGPASTTPAFQTQKPAPVQMEQLLKASSNLGTLPIIFHKLVAVINSPYASSADAANIIATDPALSAKLLRLVNSAFYGLSSKVDSIDRAVALIGTGQLVMLSMGATLVTAFKGLPVSLISMQSFWNHSLACGVVAKHIAKEAKMGKPDTFFVTGLLHDIGRLVFFHLIPAHAFYMMTEARRRQVSMRILEEECLGFTHEQFSAALLEHWGCPEELTEPIISHHNKVTDKTEEENVILPVANFLAQALGHGSSGDPSISYVSPIAWRKINILPSQLPVFSRQMDEQVRDIQILLSSST